MILGSFTFKIFLGKGRKEKSPPLLKTRIRALEAQALEPTLVLPLLITKYSSSEGMVV